MVIRSFEQSDKKLLAKAAGDNNPGPQQSGLRESRGDSEQIKNGAFLKEIFKSRPEGSKVAVCTKSGDPTEGGWPAQRARKGVKLLPSNNNYANCSTFYLEEDGSFNVKKKNFAALHIIVLDDIGTKIPWERLEGIEPTWVIETSPGNYQIGFVLSDPLTDIKQAEILIKAVIDDGLSDKGMSGVSRWARLPNAINGKPKYEIDGEPFKCSLVEWNPEQRYSMEELNELLGLNTGKDEIPKQQKVCPIATTTPIRKGNNSPDPIVRKLKELGLYKCEKEPGIHDITCPWVHEHTDAIDDGTVYFEPTDEYPKGGFKCHHSHDYNINDLHRELGIDDTGKPFIRILPGEMDAIIDRCEQVLADLGDFYRFGGMIGRIEYSKTGEPFFSPLNYRNLGRVLGREIAWYQWVKGGWGRCDPPVSHVRTLFEESSFKHLLELLGIARQPYFRESDGQLVTTAGYDPVSKLFGAFDPDDFERIEPTREAAEKSLSKIESLLSEFSFVSDLDKAIALTAIMTAVVRSSINLAPGFHVHASTIASGKSYLSEVIALFAGSGFSEKTTYPKGAEEATKVILSLLLRNPACIEFDDMDRNWKPHSVIKRMFTSEFVTERVLGVSKTATVSTRTLVLGSGNNVMPEQDLARRVLTINLDPKVEIPAALEYKNDPVATVRANRGKHIMAVINIIEAWQSAGSPKGELVNIASYSGSWTTFCRQPLAWLGIADPAVAVAEQINHDPDRETLGELLRVWHALFGDVPTTIRKAVDQQVLYQNNADDHSREGLIDALDEAIREFPVTDYNGIINKNKLGWLLKKNENKIVGGLKFIKTRSDGRVAWMVTKVESTTP